MKNKLLWILFFLSPLLISCNVSKKVVEEHRKELSTYEDKIVVLSDELVREKSAVSRLATENSEILEKYTNLEQINTKLLEQIEVNEVVEQYGASGEIISRKTTNTSSKKESSDNSSKMALFESKNNVSRLETELIETEKKLEAQTKINTELKQTIKIKEDSLSKTKTHANRVAIFIVALLLVLVSLFGLYMRLSRK